MPLELEPTSHTISSCASMVNTPGHYLGYHYYVKLDDKFYEIYSVYYHPTFEHIYRVVLYYGGTTLEHLKQFEMSGNEPVYKTKGLGIN